MTTTKLITSRPKRFTKREAILTSRALNESERKAEDDPDKRWWYDPQEFDDGHYEIVVTDGKGNEVARW